MSKKQTAPHLMIVAGEPSGDALGGQLMVALKELAAGSIKITGVGGAAMTAQGLESLYSINEIAIIGYAQIFRRLPLLLRRIGQTVNYALAENPDAVLLIDSPSYNHIIGQRLKKRGYKGQVIKYVGPQVWASRPGRLQNIAKFIDHVLLLFPFEPPYFERAGLAATFVGHPATERAFNQGLAADFRARHGIPEKAPLLCVAPGSRSNEIKYILPEFSGAIRILADQIENLHIVIPSTSNVAEAVRAGVEDWPVPVCLISGEQDKFSAFEASDAALAASGTVVLELALSRVPMVIGYKVGWFTAIVARSVLLVRFLTLFNIMADKEIIPEFIQERCRPEALAQATARLLSEPRERDAQLAETEKAVATLRVDGERPSRRAASVLLDLLSKQV